MKCHIPLLAGLLLAGLVACSDAEPDGDIAATPPPATDMDADDSDLAAVPDDMSDETPAGTTDPMPGDGRMQFAGETATDEERAACEAAGGDVMPAGRAQWDHCITSFEDAGITCTGASDCMGECLVEGEFVDAGAATTGVCSADDNPFGCYQTVENGVAGQSICVD